MTPKPEIAMIARPSDITHPASSGDDVPRAETPLQRQILLWQRELLRRAELRRSAESGAEAAPVAPVGEPSGQTPGTMDQSQ
jgi:hypothetical protein